jgi:hypothetical protein
MFCVEKGSRYDTETVKYEKMHSNHFAKLLY